MTQYIKVEVCHFRLNSEHIASHVKVSRRLMQAPARPCYIFQNEATQQANLSCWSRCHDKFRAIICQAIGATKLGRQVIERLSYMPAWPRPARKGTLRTIVWPIPQKRIVEVDRRQAPDEVPSSPPLALATSASWPHSPKCRSSHQWPAPHWKDTSKRPKKAMRRARAPCWYVQPRSFQCQ